MQVALENLAAVEALAGKIAPLLKRGDVLQLKGDLGVGKTTFTRALIHALAKKTNNQGTLCPHPDPLPEGEGDERSELAEGIEVPSPTFTIVQQYDLPQFTLYHFDLYRLKNSDELIEVGLEQALSEGVAVLEWPELAAEFLPQDSLVLEFSYLGQGRVVEISAPTSWPPLSL